ncbi:MAG: hypothetical protein ACI86H_000323 [bacterium]|jgi:hypothetical protein
MKKQPDKLYSGKVILADEKDFLQSLLPENPSQVIRDILNLGIEGKKPFISAKELGEKYLKNKRYPTTEKKIDALIKREKIKNFSAGCITNFGGLITLPISIPSTLFANWVLQTRMAAAIAHIVGFDIDDPAIRMMAFLSILGESGNNVLNKTVPILIESIQKNKPFEIPEELIEDIHEISGKRVAKFLSQKGAYQATKTIPLLSGIIGGINEYNSCKDTATFAKNIFLSASTNQK